MGGRTSAGIHGSPGLIAIEMVRGAWGEMMLAHLQQSKLETQVLVCFGGLNTKAMSLAIGSMDPFLGSALIGPGLWHATIGWTRDTGSLLDALFLPTRF